MNREIHLRRMYACAALQALHGQTADIFTQSLMPYTQKRIDALANTAFAIADAMINAEVASAAQSEQTK